MNSIYWKPPPVLSETEWRSMEHEMNILKVVQSAPTLTPDDSYWIVSGGPQEFYHVNKHTGGVITVLTMPLHAAFSSRNLGSTLSSSSTPRSIADAQSANYNGAVYETMNSLSIRNRTSDYLMRIIVDPRLRSSRMDCVLEVSLDSDVSPIVRIEHLQTLDMVSWVVSRDDVEKHKLVRLLVISEHSGTMEAPEIAALPRF